MACDSVRVDTADFNSGITQNVSQVVTDTARGKVYFMWTENKTLGATHNRTVQFRSYTPATAAFGGVVQIDDTSSGTVVDNDCAGALLQLSDGTLIAIYGQANNSYTKESTDFGATWSASRVVIEATTVRGVFCGCVDEATGLVAFAIVQQSSGGTGGGDLWAWKRTGIQTWTLIGVIHDAAGISTPPFFRGTSFTEAEGATRNMVMKDASVGCMIGDFDAAGGTYNVSVLSTINGWASATLVTVASYPNIITRCPKMRVGSDNRIRATWFDDNNTSTNRFPVIAYSDDWGATWVVVGTPSICIGAYAWDDSGNRAYDLGIDNSWYMSTLDNESESGAYFHRIFYGGDSLSGWQLRSCQLAFTAWSGASSGESFFYGRDFFRVFNKVVTGKYQVNFLMEEDVDVPGGGGAPPLIEESPSGTDLPNMYLMLDIADKRGWSAHQVGVTQFFEWPEGDYTTERRIPWVLGAVGSLDANIQDPAILPAFWKMDDPERWGRETLIKNADATFTYIDDPFLMVWRSIQLEIGEAGGANLMRAVYLRYRREIPASFDVEVWIDDVIADVQTIPPAWPNPAEFWWPIPRATNVGSIIQLRVEDRERQDLIVEAFSIKFKSKHWRMRG